HFGPVWSLDFSLDGRKLISGSGDYSLRLWSETLTEPVIPEVERECQHIETVVKEINEDIQDENQIGCLSGAALPTNETIEMADQLNSFLVKPKQDMENKDTAPLFGSNLSKLFSLLKRINYSDLENVLKLVELENVVIFFIILKDYNDWENLELIAQCSLSLLRINALKLLNNKNFKEILEIFEKNVAKKIYDLQSMIRKNTTAMSMVKRHRFSENLEENSKRMRYIHL
ncbi:MAG: Dip2/Utp12 protein, partial [Paramarteilia canceri]